MKKSLAHLPAYKRERRGGTRRVGFNNKDDSGKEHADAKEGEKWDDLAVRMPAAK